MAAVDALSLDGGHSGRDLGRWAMAGAVMLAVHAGALLLLRDAPPPSGFESQQPIEMDLMPPPSGAAQMSEAGADSAPAAAAEAVPQVQPEETEPTPTEAEELPELNADAAPPPPDEAITAEAAPDEAQPIEETPVEQVETAPDLVEAPTDVTPAVTLPPERTVTAEDVTPEPRRETPPPVREAKKPVKREATKPKKTETRTVERERPKAAPPPSASSRAGGARGVASNPGAARAAAAEYGRKISAILAGQKRYPAAARAQRATGRGVIAFTVNRSGRVISQSLARSTGNAILDQELRAMLQRASGSFPPMPPEMPGGSKSFTIPIGFTFSG
ncbi:TonB family protein [Hansschlegelia sp. KR7-227]|uniref:TonB family protein n=1 Tax=Hansschlegelia sp. KR7-227 TaxID=3400914 RepID=UPI003C07443C